VRSNGRHAAWIFDECELDELKESEKNGLIPTVSITKA
jgi:hypothetical protein